MKKTVPMPVLPDTFNPMTADAGSIVFKATEDGSGYVLAAVCLPGASEKLRKAVQHAFDVLEADAKKRGKIDAPAAKRRRKAAKKVPAKRKRKAAAKRVAK